MFIAGVGAWLFLHHDILYLRGGDAPEGVSPQAYAFTMAVLYVFIRLTSLVATLRAPVAPRRAGICPECGQPLDHAARHVGSSVPSGPRGTAYPDELAVLPSATIGRARGRAPARRAIPPAHDEVTGLIPGVIENRPVPSATVHRSVGPMDPSRRMKEPWRPFG